MSAACTRPLRGAALAAVTILAAACGSPGDDAPAAGTWRVERRPFEVRLTEQAQFEADSVIAVASTLPSNLARVVYLAPEGSLVAPGDEVARFDPAPFVNDLAQAERELEDAATQLERARVEAELKRTDLGTRDADLRRRLASAELERKRIAEVENPARLRAAADQLATARTEAEQAQKTRDVTLQLEQRGFASRDELAAAETALSRAEQTAAARAAELKLVETVELKTALEQADLEIAHLRQELKTRVADQPLELSVASGTVSRFEARIRQLEATAAAARQYIEASVIRAPVGGIVDYPLLSFGDERRKVQIGDTLWQRQTFLVLPDLDSLVARVRVREADVGGIAAGQAVELMPQAFPGLALAGTVLSVGTLIDDTGGTARFEVRVDLTGSDPRLRPGMNAKAVILTHNYADVAVVPIDAVHYDQGRPVAYVQSAGRFAPVPLTLGGADGALIAVESGLAAGEIVALTKPAAPP